MVEEENSKRKFVTDFFQKIQLLDVISRLKLDLTLWLPFRALFHSFFLGYTSVENEEKFNTDIV